MSIDKVSINDFRVPDRPINLHLFTTNDNFGLELLHIKEYRKSIRFNHLQKWQYQSPTGSTPPKVGSHST